MLQSVRIRAAKAVDGMKILRGFFLMWVRLPPPAPLFQEPSQTWLAIYGKNQQYFPIHICVLKD
jgi:hypothetical protein